MTVALNGPTLPEILDLTEDKEKTALPQPAIVIGTDSDTNTINTLD